MTRVHGRGLPPTPRLSTEAVGAPSPAALVTPDAPMRAAPAVGGEPLAEAKRLHAQGERRTALALYVAALRTPTLSAETRADAGLAAADLALDIDKTGDRAETYYREAHALGAPPVVAALVLVRLLVARSDGTAALEIVDELLQRTPEDADLHARRARLLVDEARVDEAVLAGDRAVAFAKTPAALRNAKLALAESRFRARDAAGARELMREVLREDPENIAAHDRIAQLVLHSFDPATRSAVQEQLADANAAFQRGDFAAVRAAACAALAIDADDGLAHKLFTLASDRLQAERDGAVPPLIEPLSTAEEREALVRQLKRVVRRARVDKPKRRAVIRDLFPDWDLLTPVQQAAVAWSALPYAKVLPYAIEAGAQYRFVLPGTSALTVDPSMKPADDHNAFGRYYYAIRGWHRNGFVVTGVERIEDAARGLSHTVTHELAHMLHWVIRKAANAAAKGKPPSDDLRRTLATFAEAIESLYAQAKAGHARQLLLDAYSGTTDREYFAQGFMAFLNVYGRGKQNPRRLFTRNPALWDLVQRLCAHTAEFPALVPGPNPEPEGLDDEAPLPRPNLDHI